MERAYPRSAWATLRTGRGSVAAIHGNGIHKGPAWARPGDPQNRARTAIKLDLHGYKAGVPRELNENRILKSDFDRMTELQKLVRARDACGRSSPAGDECDRIVRRELAGRHRNAHSGHRIASRNAARSESCAFLPRDDRQAENRATTAAAPGVRRINNILFEYDLGDYRGTAPMYFGSYAPLVVDAMKRYLTPGDTFIDVGANIGYLSAIAAGLVGERGQVHSFEPVPAYFDRLNRLAQLNPEHSIIVNSCAAGDKPDTCTIYVTREPGQNTLVRSYKSEVEIVATLEVPVVRLDSYIDTHHIDRVALIKIDAEGFELPVLRGLGGYFEKSAWRPPIICEIAPRAYPLMGLSVHELAAFMSGFGYTPRDLIDGVRPLNLSAIKHVEDVLFVAEDI